MCPLNWRKAIRKNSSTKKSLGLLHLRVYYPLTDRCPFRFAQWAIFKDDGQVTEPPGRENPTS